MKKYLVLNLLIVAVTFSFFYFKLDSNSTITAEDFRQYKIQKKKEKSKLKYDQPDKAMLWTITKSLSK
jgi:hypothetical protein